MSESRFSVDDILKEVEQMRKREQAESSVHTEPQKPTKVEPLHVEEREPAKAEHAHTEVREPAKAEPVHTEAREPAKAEPVHTEVREPERAMRHAAADQTDHIAQTRAFDFNIKEPQFDKERDISSKKQETAPEEDSTQKLSDFLSKTEDTGYTPGSSEDVKHRIDRLYDGRSDVVVDPLKKARRQYNPNVLTPEEINNTTVIMPAVKQAEMHHLPENEPQKPNHAEPQKKSEPEYDYDEIDDYYSMRDAEDIRGEFKARLNGVNIRMAITLILSLLGASISVLPAIGVKLPDLISSGYGLLCAHAVLLLAAVFTNFTSVIRGFFSIFILRSQIDSPAAVGVAAAIAQIIYLCFIPAQADNSFIFAPAAIFALFCSLCGKRVLLSRVLKNFRLVATSRAKQSAFVASEEDADKIAPEEIGDPVVCCQKSVINLRGYMHNALCEDPADTVCRIVAPVALAVAVIAGLVAWSLTSNMTTVFNVVAGFGVACVPVAALLSTTLPLATLSRSLREMGAMVSGYNAVAEFSDVNAAVLTDEDLFPSGSIEMVSVKATGSRKINEVMMYAAALCVNTGGAFADVFDRLIEGRREDLPKTCSLVCRDGEGIVGSVDGSSVKIGTRELMKKDGCIDLPDNEFEVKIIRSGSFPYYISIDGELCGICLLRHNNIVDTDNLEYIRRMVKAGVALYIRTNDPYITPELISDLFNVPKKAVFILNSKQCEAHAAITEPEENGDSLISNNNSAAAFACAIAGCKKVRQRITYSVFIQIVFLVVGVAALAYFWLTGSTEYTSSWCMLAYQAVSMLGVSLIPRLFSLK